MILSHAPLDVTNAIFKSLTYKQRCTCALVCSAWADAAPAATCSIVLKKKIRDMTSLQLWIQKHGHRLEELQLLGCYGSVLVELPCAQLYNLLLHGSMNLSNITTYSKVWSDIAAATQLTSLSLAHIQTSVQQADVVSALTALPDLQELTWCYVKCSTEQNLSSSVLLQQLTHLTSLALQGVTAAAFRHVAALSKLQQLKVAAAKDWTAAGCPELERLQSLTSLQLQYAVSAIPASISQLTALQQLDVSVAQYSSLLTLTQLQGLTRLRVKRVAGMTFDSAPLPLPALQHLELLAPAGTRMPTRLLSSCKDLQDVSLSRFSIEGPGPLIGSSNLQRLVLVQCRLPSAWQEVFPATLQLPHLTTLLLPDAPAALPTVAIEAIVACCGNLQVLQLPVWKTSLLAALSQLQSLTQLTLDSMRIHDPQCSSLAQLTGLLELELGSTQDVSVVGWRQLAALTQLTSLGFYRPNRDNSKLSNRLWQVSDKVLVNNPKESTARRPVNRGSWTVLTNKAPSGAPPDVAPRLLKACKKAEADRGSS